jgi:hypothetical protein
MSASLPKVTQPRSDDPSRYFVQQFFGQSAHAASSEALQFD